MKKHITIILIAFALTTQAQVRYSTSKITWNVRTNQTAGVEPTSSSFTGKTIVCWNVADSILYFKENSTVLAKYAFYRYSATKKNVFLKVATSSATYGAPKYLYYVKTSATPGNIPPPTDNTAPNLLFWNTADNIIYRFVANVITPIYRIHAFAVDTYTNYYIATNGNDTTGEGTISSPWRSLYKATQTVTAIDSRINIAAGTYLENHKCNLAVGVSVSGAGDEYTIIKSNYSNSTYSNGVLTLYSAVTNTPGNQSISGITFDGNNETCYRPIVVQNRGNVLIHDCTFKDFKDSPAVFLGESYEYYREATTWVTGNKFHSNKIYNCSTNTAEAQGLWFSGQDGFEVYDCDFQNLKGGKSGDAISSKTNKRWYIHDNIINRLPYQVGYWNFSTEIRWNYGECKFYNNNVTGGVDLCWNYSNGYDYSIDVYNCTFGHSLTSSSTTWNIGLDFEADNYNLLVRNNTFKNLAVGVIYGIGFKSSPVKLSGLTIKNNLFDNIGSPSNIIGYYESAIYIRPNQNDHSVRDIYIYNNTIKQAAYSKGALTLGGQGTQRNINIQNNIITGFSTAPATFMLTNAGTLSIDTLNITHNNFYSNSINTVQFTGVTPTHYTNSNNTTTNPLLNSVYLLQDLSPAINAGVNVGTPYLGTAPDQGAFEKK